MGRKIPCTHVIVTFQYEFEASFLEIYNESIRDLLTNHGADVKHEIKLTGTGSNDVTVTNLTTINVSSEAQVGRLQFFSSHGFGNIACPQNW